MSKLQLFSSLPGVVATLIAGPGVLAQTTPTQVGGQVQRPAASDARDASFDTAVRGGLAWLARHQNPDGSWSALTLKDRCTTKLRCTAGGREYTNHFDVGVTGLALQAFFGAKELPGKQLELPGALNTPARASDEVARKGLDWLLAQQADDGHFGSERSHVYNDAAATLAVCLAFQRTKDEALLAPAQRAVDFLVAAQRPSPKGAGVWGWRYAPRQDIEKQYGISEKDRELARFGPASGAGVAGKTEKPEQQGMFEREIYDADTSATGNVIAALNVARAAGLNVDPASFAGAREYVKWVTATNGKVGYNDPKVAGSAVTGKDDHYTYHPAVMSALALSMHGAFGTDAAMPILGSMRDVVLEDVPAVSKDGLSVDYYYWQQGVRSLSAIQVPSDARSRAATWRDGALSSILKLQDHTEDACSQGGWVFADRWSYAGGPIYATALNVITLEKLQAAH